MRVLLLGGGGYPNYGDELIAATTAAFWLSVGAEVLLNSFNPVESQRFFAMRGIVASHTQSIWDDAQKREYSSLRDAIAAGGRGHDCIAGIDVVHLHGGGYINSMWRSSAYLIGVAHAYRRTGARIFATGLGLEPLIEDDAKALAEAANLFEVFECRDGSAARLRENGAKQVINGVDDAFLEPRSRRQRKLVPDLNIALSFDQATPAYRSEVLAWLQDAIERDRRAFDKIVLWEFCERNHDLELVREGLDLSLFEGRVEVRSFAEMSRGGHAVAEGDLAVASRFHAHLLFARAGARGIYVPGPDSYYQGKHQSLVDQGSLWRSFDEARSIGGLAVGSRSLTTGAEGRARRAKRIAYRPLLNYAYPNRVDLLVAKARTAWRSAANRRSE